MKQYILTKNTEIIKRGSKNQLTKELNTIHKELKKKKTNILEYVRTEKILYKDKKSEEICIFEVREY